MPNQPHDQNFKNLFLDFPRESLSWLFPQALETWGEVRHVEFVRQEPKKNKLSDFREKYADAILSGKMDFLPGEAFIRLKVQGKNSGMTALARMMEAEFDELGKQVTITILREDSGQCER
jgi:predicted transposase YdaD